MPNTTTHYGWQTVDSDGYVKDTATYLAAFATQVDNTLYDINGGTAHTGLQLITNQDFSYSASVALDNVFTSTYERYLVKVNVTLLTSVADLLWQFRIGGANTTSGYYGAMFYNTYNSALASGNQFSNSGYAWAGYPGTSGGFSDIEVYPFGINSSFTLKAYSASYAGNYHGGYNTGDGTNHDGFRIYTSGGTMSGNVQVYGYRKS